MRRTVYFPGRSPGFLTRVLVVFLCAALAGPLFTAVPVMAAPGDTTVSPVVPMELPVEPEIEVSPAASLKQAPLWKEVIQLLKNPYANIQDPDFASDPNARITAAPIARRPGFGATMPALKIWSPSYNHLTGQPLRLHTSDGEISWDQPGPLFDNAEPVPVDAFNVPQTVRTPIGALVACPLDPAAQYTDIINSLPRGQNPCLNAPAGSLAVLNPGGNGNNPRTPRGAFGFAGNGQHPSIPPNGTVVAVSGFVGGALQELNGTSTTATIPAITPLPIPVNEEDFLRPTADTAGIPAALSPYIGRPGAETLGKALFWDMQVGSDGVQSCGTCHFAGGIDTRTKNQLNPNHLGGDVFLSVKGPNQNVVAGDFPFHKLVSPDISSEETNCGFLGQPACAGGGVIHDSNDVMSSMGVKYRLFVDIPPIGAGSFGAASAVGGVKPLLPDVGTVVRDPIDAAKIDPLTFTFVDPATGLNLRRVEPRNTPTMIGAAFNFDNFWDGRARFEFNGGSVFGASDPTAHIFIDPGTPDGAAAVNLQPATNGHIRPELIAAGDPSADQPVRIRFSSLASQSVGPPLSNFEMSFDGRNHAKIGKKLLQGDTTGQDAIQANEVTPLANQLVAVADSRLGPFSNQGGSVCTALGRPTAVGKPGLCISYGDLIRLSFDRQFWQNTNRHLNGAACGAADPFDGYCLAIANGVAAAANTNQFRQIEANFSLFFGLAFQTYAELLIPDNTPFDQFMDANPLAANGIGQPGEQRVVFPTLVRELVTGSPTGNLTMVPGFGPDELLGFDIFAGGNLTAALPAGSPRNPIVTVTNAEGQQVHIAIGSNPFSRSPRCGLCHIGPEMTDHSATRHNNLLKSDVEFEFPSPHFVPDPNHLFPAVPGFGFVMQAPEPPGPLKVISGLMLVEDLDAVDVVEVEPRNFSMFDNPATPWDDRIVAQPGFFAFGDHGISNLGLRPVSEDVGRGGGDPFGFPLSRSALVLMNVAQPGFEPCNLPTDSCVMTNVDPNDLGATFEETGGGLDFAGAPGYTLQSINPGLEQQPIIPTLPPYMAPWAYDMPDGELHPQPNELAFAPNIVTPPISGPAVEYGEFMFGADVHCALYNPALFGDGPPNFGWGPPTSTARLCPNNSSGVANNYDVAMHGTWPVPNRVSRMGAFKVPGLRNVELTGPYFHTGSFLTLRQVVDFYMRGGDFPITNKESRDPFIMDPDMEAFAFGPTAAADVGAGPVNIFVNTISGADCSANPAELGCVNYNGNLADALPDAAFQYHAMPDTTHAITPEYLTPEEAKVALVKFLLSLTDERVKLEKAPFDRPELFVPVDGTAPDNTSGSGTGVVAPAIPAPGTLVALSSCSVLTPCPLPGPDGIFGTADDIGPAPGPDLVFGTPDDLAITAPLFKRLAAVGSAGRLLADGVTPDPLPAFLGVTNNPLADCVTEISHFCR